MQRYRYLEKIQQGFVMHPVVAILGPRQCGKTTLAQTYAQDASEVTIFDLEDFRDLAKLDDPLLALEHLRGLIVIDEIQLRPELFPTIRVLADKYKHQQRYLILGSASRELIRQSSETLAGRIAYIELTPFSLIENTEMQRLWLRGGFPLSYLADSVEQSQLWRENYIKTFLEKDIPNLGINVSPHTLRRFWMMLTHYHGQIMNMSEIGKSLGVSNTAIRHYLGILTGTFMVRELHPWYENIKKRQVKTPKIYFRDTGILHSLLNIHNQAMLVDSPKCGASWEGFALEQVITYHAVDNESCYFWSVHAGAEVDLLIIQGEKRIGFEFKYNSSPRLTKSMQTAYDTLKLNSLVVIYPGMDDYPLAAGNIRAIGLEKYLGKV
jgi:predicted AAA+ superfamily ATPase